jgi:SET domain-containing protein
MPPRSSNVRVGKARNGLGLRARRQFAAGERIIPITGVVRDAMLVTRTGGSFADNCFRYGPETYLDPGDGFGSYLNHSCAPNAAVRKVGHRLHLHALRAIRRSEEIVMDYSTILGDDDIWTMRCNCGARECRGRIKRLGAIPAAARERLIAVGAVPKYIVATLEG